jgi:hypothetical protein
MLGQKESEKDTLLGIYYNLGKMFAHTKEKPIEAIQEIIKSDPEKLNAFLNGVQAEQLINIIEENKVTVL